MDDQKSDVILLLLTSLFADSYALSEAFPFGNATVLELEPRSSIYLPQPSTPPAPPSLPSLYILRQRPLLFGLCSRPAFRYFIGSKPW
jgi:hypothetical protein